MGTRPGVARSARCTARRNQRAVQQSAGESASASPIAQLRVRNSAVIQPKCEAARILLCDDIREEVDGRQSLIGVWGPSLRVVRLPYLHRGLSVFVQLVNPAEGYDAIEYELCGPDSSIVARGGGP